ncbi:hypothetical protein EK21DRAFT_107155 [Setomelanomma holmii]|uniref:Uncharacterized protein n=1 Tax=Setomelanomma holmii TaxID=210430 RepID=A0A9P4HI39_9PLEO|nr:hypothetical protein EK21DRAFT_107155 [Setomelanomma holmii]
MRTLDVVLGVAATFSISLAQTTKRYCDPATSICYSGWTGTNDITFGIALPETTTAPFDTVLVEYSYIKGTGYNDTHWTLNVRYPTTIAQKFAYGLAAKALAQPANNRSTFNVHNSFDNYKLDLTQGQNTDFDKLVAANLIQDTPPIPSSIVSTRPTPLSTSIIPLATSQPTQTGVPSSCMGSESLAFPVKTAQGWKATKVASGLTQPRGLIFDSAGHLLCNVHEIQHDSCFSSSKTLIRQANLNHGIVLSLDGKTLFASSATSVYTWSYDAVTMTVSANSTAIVTGFDSKGHVTRTFVIPPKHPNLLLVSHGSNDDYDYGAADPKIGRSMVKVFDLTKVPAIGYNYAAGGYQMGYGLRNQVGPAFDGDGMLWGVENSSDKIHRTINNTSIDIHADNPADELNYLGDPSIKNNN